MGHLGVHCSGAERSLLDGHYQRLHCSVQDHCFVEDHQRQDLGFTVHYYLIVDY